MIGACASLLFVGAIVSLWLIKWGIDLRDAIKRRRRL